MKQVHKQPSHTHKLSEKKMSEKKKSRVDLKAIKADVAKQLRGVLGATRTNDGFVLTGIAGFDYLLTTGIPQHSSILVAGGAGSGKTLFCLQTLFNAARNGERCLYLSFEESPERLQEHMKAFSWDLSLVKKNLRIVRKNPFLLTTSVEAMLAHARGELLIDLNEVLDIIPKGFIPDRVVVDSVTAIAAAFGGKDENYRVFIEQLFRYFEGLGVTVFMISETDQMPQRYSPAGVEEFLADGVFVLYSVRNANVREHGIEVLKLRGVDHAKKIVALRISGDGVVVHEDQELFL